MDPVAKHEAQRMAEQAVRTIIEAVFEYDPTRDMWHVREGTSVTGEMLHRMVRDAVGVREPLTVETMERSISDALNTSR